MASTVVQNQTIRAALDSGNTNILADCFRKMQLGHAQCTVKVNFINTPGTLSTVNLTTASALTQLALSGGTVTGIDLQPGETLPAIDQVVTLRVTGGNAISGPRYVTDAGGVATSTVALLASDGRSLVFDASVTALTLAYKARAAFDISTTTLATGEPV